MIPYLIATCAVLAAAATALNIRDALAYHAWVRRELDRIRRS